MLKPGLKLIVLVVSAAIFYFSNVSVSIAANSSLYGSCGTEVDCAYGLTCHNREGYCVECIGPGEGAPEVKCPGSEPCKNGICVSKGGNGKADFCRSNEDCKTGLECDEDSYRCVEKSVEGGGGQTGSGPGKDGPLGYDLTIQGVGNIITGIACWLIGVIFAVMIIALVVAGVRFFLASGNAAKIEAARKNLLWVVIGIAVIIATNIIIATIAKFLGADFSLLPLKCEGVNTRVVPVRTCQSPDDCEEGYVCDQENKKCVPGER